MIEIRDSFFVEGAILDERGNTATLAFTGPVKMTEGSQYLLNGKRWKAIKITPSDYNTGVVNVDLILL